MFKDQYGMKYITGIIFFTGLLQCAIGQDSTRYARPFFTSAGKNRVAENTVYNYHVQAKDSAGYPVSFLATKLPEWLRFDSASAIISGRTDKAGQYTIEVEASNQRSTSKQRFILTVYNNKTSNILCLGNSITNGTSSYNSYRRALWQMLHQNNYNFDLIGSWSSHHMGGEVPDPDFDMDHDGHSGWNFADIFHPPSWDSVRGNINEWLKSYKPDIVLLELGTNDVFQCRSVNDIHKDFEELVKVLRKKNSSVKIFVAQIPPLGKQWATQKLCGNDIDYGQAILQLNKALAGFCATYSSKVSPLIVVDQYSGLDPSTEMYDDIHPNAAGEKKMAEKWFESIHKYISKLK
jgi:lysophospholipase L1-like esterase